MGRRQADNKKEQKREEIREKNKEEEEENKKVNSCYEEEWGRRYEDIRKSRRERKSVKK